MLTITWSLTNVLCKQIISNDKKCRRIAGDFDHHADAAVQCGVHRPMEHIQGFTRSHWMLPLGKCLCRIALAAVMVHEFVQNTQNTNKKLFSASNLWYNQPLVVCENFVPQNGPSTQLIDATSCVKMSDAAIVVAEELNYILSYKMLSKDKIQEVINLERS
jgi:hypothetical protein